MSKGHKDSATLIAQDEAARQADLKRLDKMERAMPGSGWKELMARAQTFDDAARRFNDPGHEHGPSIKCPDIYEALRRKGYSKEKAARISNSRC